MKSIAIITARGASKRIPRKNIKPFNGIPIIAYSIKAAIESGLFDVVMVSTDDQEIAEISKQYGAQVPFMRSEKNSDDYATTADVLMEVLDRYKEMGMEFDYMTCLYPTNPFITVEKLVNAMTALKDNNASEVILVVSYSYPPQRSYVVSDKGRIVMKWPEFETSRSQDLEKMYHDAGQFYCYNVKDYLDANGRIKKNILPIICTELEVQDIDNIEDWKLAEIKHKFLMENR